MWSKMIIRKWLLVDVKCSIAGCQNKMRMLHLVRTSYQEIFESSLMCPSIPWEEPHPETFNHSPHSFVMTLRLIFASKKEFKIIPSWWFQPIWNLFSQIGSFPQLGVKKKCLKPPPRLSFLLICDYRSRPPYLCFPDSFILKKSSLRSFPPLFQKWSH